MLIRSWRGMGLPLRLWLPSPALRNNIMNKKKKKVVKIAMDEPAMVAFKETRRCTTGVKKFNLMKFKMRKSVPRMLRISGKMNYAHTKASSTFIRTSTRISTSRALLSSRRP
ncbi:unnamed protein product [Polarella glacialis]|uniref:Uncharacterized protein n=1 Tax=Polarella glacialis TaxID=89957 RepID=A0A813G7J4_POLGL|nr:unnamed protein product [Polarella glacialis]CAE8644110.1 unnamed protein product [Polarella glacialis]